MAQQGADSPLTALQPDLSGPVDPDEAFSRVPYEKGFALLCALAACLGGDGPMLAFFRAYLAEFKGRTVCSEQFRAFATRWAEGCGRGAQLGALDWAAWLRSPGMPPTIQEFDGSLAQASAALAARWAAGETAGCGPEDVAGWSSLQRQTLLDQLLELVRAQQSGGAGAALGDAETVRLGSLYGFGKGGGARGGLNCEEAFRFYRLCLACAGGSACSLQGEVLAFLKSNGRMKYVRPLYRDLCATEDGRAAALQTYLAWRANYHPIAQHMLSLDLGLRS